MVKNVKLSEFWKFNCLFLLKIETKNQFARDDPAFVVLLSAFLISNYENFLFIVFSTVQRSVMNGQTKGRPFETFTLLGRKEGWGVTLTFK